MKRIALVTYAGCPQLSEDDQLLVPILRQIGVEAHAVLWDDRSADWSSFDEVILRSCWDYHLRPLEFGGWVDALESRSIPLQNPAPLLRWNLDKRYLRQLEKCGIAIPVTYWLEDGDEVRLRDVLVHYGWDCAVVKPTVSAMAHQTRRVFASDRSSNARGPAMVQEFIPEIEMAGEWSLIFLGGEFSHAVRKLPAPGDFRVQTQFGGSVLSAAASARLIDQGESVLRAIGEQPLYARVDGVERDGLFVLMELELIEPVLFLGLAGAAARFAKQICHVMMRPKRESKTACQCL